ncbi:hypothetical protein [Curtobacterium sp. ZW137]|uniref:hypothetical protein n=1 Tax=Curtobacterium sp. ZW137 TaxID=2485104 RepID=UPI000F4CFE6D|nr:hypothetical protein [Curtobacterium sp. ZW137]ROP64860.1 hypothetical protein EDF55_1512 [Curtobacterium sp. ZW137]
MDGGWFVAGAFALWFAVALIAQLRVPAVSVRRRFDVLGLVPSWNLFAPRPIITDYLVWYRLWSDGAPGDWVRVPIPRPRRWTDAVLNTSRRSRKALWTAAHTISWSSGDVRVPVLDPSYLLVLGVVSRHAERAGTASGEIQYRVDCVRAALADDSERLRWFLSERHALGGTDA